MCYFIGPLAFITITLLVSYVIDKNFHAVHIPVGVGGESTMGGKTFLPKMYEIN